MRQASDKVIRGLLLLGVLVCGWGLSPAVQAAPPMPVVEPELWRALTTPTDTPLRVVVTLRLPSGPDPLTQAMVAGSDPVQRRAVLMGAMQATLARSLPAVAPLLAEAEAKGTLLARRDLWVINGLALTARPDLVRTLAESPAVAELRLDHYRQYISDQPSISRQPSAISQFSTFNFQLSTSSSPTWGVTQIRAPEVWATLGISGTGAVVAGMDTGADWQHPALHENYRGNLGHGLADHDASWYDAVNDGTYPYDDHGHGTHTLGTAVGSGGIGVAPAARWIAVKVLSGEGYGYDSWIHAGFQWLLAPGGDPALAPDVVNASWGNSNGALTTFQADIAALVAAGIFPAFAAGNDGPYPNTLGSPASLPGVFAVGASDPDDGVAGFSSRGPSPFGEIKPYVVAPGVSVLSAIPGGVYQNKQGTSMATPHVAGLAALLRAISPTVAIATMAQIITQTAVPLTVTLPNNASGWGRVDAFAAAVALGQAGLVTGTVRDTAGPALAGAVIAAAPHGGGRAAQTLAAADGSYRLALVPAPYDLTASTFGYVAQTVYGVQVVTQTARQVDFSLTALPTGTVQGQVSVMPGGQVPTRPVVLRPLGTPVTATLDAAGAYTLTLPAGTYTVEVRGNGYHVVTATVAVIANTTVRQDFALTPAPTLLLVDSGPWYYSSQIGYWRAGLDGLRYAYDERAIKHPGPDTPLSNTLAAYDIVLWSAPQDSPGVVGAGSALQDYLDGGGRLWLSGQDIAFFDAGGYIFDWPQPYLYNRISAWYWEDDAPSRTLTGLGAFEGMTITIAGGDGADNQTLPDQVTVLDPGKAALTWRYQDGMGGGVGASICTPYRALFFSFGYEAIADATVRREVMVRALDWLTTSPLTTGLTLAADPAPQISLPGTRVTHTLTLRHIGQGGPADAFTVTLAGATWPTTVTPATALLSPCQSVTLTVVVTIPPAAGVNAADWVTLTVASALVPQGPTAVLHTKTPAPLLLVDDDRWYEMESRYQAALDRAGIPYDVWDTRHSIGGTPDAGSPLTATLARYPLILWFTGYDWYEPVTQAEESSLLHYLDQGGRLLLSGQDFLYYHGTGPLATRLGVATWAEDWAPTAAAGVPDQVAGGLWGPVALNYPFNNWSDSVEPAPTAVPVVRDAQGAPLGVAAGAEVTPAWRSLFYSFPLETVLTDTRPLVLSHALDWLSPVGLSDWSVAPTAPLPGERVTATLRLYHDAPATTTIALTATFPASLTLDAGAPPLTWSGDLAPRTPLTLTWGLTVAPDAPAGLLLTPTVALALPAWGLTFHRENPMRVAAPDLAASGWLSPEGSRLLARRPVTLTVVLRNRGPAAVISGTAQVWLMKGLTPLTATVPPTRGVSMALWAGALAAGGEQTLTVPLKPWSWEGPLRADLLLADGMGGRWERRLWLEAAPLKVYLPVVLRGAH